MGALCLLLFALGAGAGDDGNDGNDDGNDDGNEWQRRWQRRDDRPTFEEQVRRLREAGLDDDEIARRMAREPNRRREFPGIIYPENGWPHPGTPPWVNPHPAKSRRAAAGRAELLAKKRHTDRLQNPAKLRRFRIGGRIWGG